MECRLGTSEEDGVGVMGWGTSKAASDKQGETRGRREDKASTRCRARREGGRVRGRRWSTIVGQRVR